MNNDDHKTKGRLVARELCIEDFKASDGWLRRWKRRAKKGGPMEHKRYLKTMLKK